MIQRTEELLIFSAWTAQICQNTEKVGKKGSQRVKTSTKDYIFRSESPRKSCRPYWIFWMPHLLYSSWTTYKTHTVYKGVYRVLVMAIAFKRATMRWSGSRCLCVPVVSVDRDWKRTVQRWQTLWSACLLKVLWNFLPWYLASHQGE